MVTGAGNVLECISDCGSTGSNCQTGYTSFKGGYALFKNSLGGVSQTTVDIPRILQAETGGCVSRIVKYIRSSLVNRYCTGISCRVCLLLFYFLAKLCRVE